MPVEESSENTGVVSQQRVKRKSYNYGLQYVAMFSNSKLYRWKDCIRTATKISFFSFPKNDADMKEWCRLIKRENNDGFCVKVSRYLPL